ncbi:hypothetical protein BDV95DRAFT_669044 [Massariosphaeria phaeospora]|uniref:Uncharacterized protein n=1 Tax=Massariosphaeria phaeospora TaxID=100035 RepID=A0A7C8I8N3_9PLEO|nr:hypothetical protein BDV95DRAFT_669044 [Massariosphaeria phaeospora]
MFSTRWSPRPRPTTSASPSPPATPHTPINFMPQSSSPAMFMSARPRSDNEERSERLLREMAPSPASSTHSNGSWNENDDGDGTLVGEGGDIADEGENETGVEDQEKMKRPSEVKDRGNAGGGLDTAPFRRPKATKSRVLSTVVVVLTMLLICALVVFLVEGVEGLGVVVKYGGVVGRGASNALECGLEGAGWVVGRATARVVKGFMRGYHGVA